MNDNEIIDIFLLLDAVDYPEPQLYDCATYKAAFNGEDLPSQVTISSSKIQPTRANGYSKSTGCLAAVSQ
ncbi:hypothetical protein BH11BAC3_BH11BAC3_08260 [soil metagenome]